MSTIVVHPIQDSSLWTTAVPNQSPALIIISCLFLFATTLFFTARLLWRLLHHQRGWDDLFATAAFVTLIIQTAFGGMAAHYGFGKHRLNIQQTFKQAMFYFYLYQICYKLLGGFTKLTFCALYWRIFDRKNFRWMVGATATITAMGTLAFTIGTVFQCTPVKRAWDRQVAGTCTSNKEFWYSHAAFNTFMDIIVYVLPIPLINTLKVTSRTRKGLLSIFALGAFVIAASIVRMVMLKGSAESSDDPTWGSMPALIWTEVEANTSVIVCCLPALRMLSVRVWNGVRGKEVKSTTPNVSGLGLELGNGDGGGGRGRDDLRMGHFSNIRYSPPTSPRPSAASTYPWKRNRLVDASSEYQKQTPMERLYSTMGFSTRPDREEESPTATKVSYLAPKLDWGGNIYKKTEVTVESRSRDSLAHQQGVEAGPADGGPMTMAELFQSEATRKGY